MLLQCLSIRRVLYFILRSLFMNLYLKSLIFWFCMSVCCSQPLVIIGCSGTRAVVPPVNVENQQTYQVGKFVWFDLFTTDIEQAAPFYEHLFGWKPVPVHTSSPALMTIFSNDKPIGNIVQRKKDTQGSKWLSYLSVADFDLALKAINSAHGKIINNIGDLPDRGQVAIVSDDQKATFAIIKSSSGDPGDEEFGANQWVDCELWTKNVNMAVLFYGQIVQYESETIPLTETITYTQLMRDGLRRGGIVKIPWKGIESEWIPYVAVRDISSMTAKVKELGGKILLEPEIESIDGRVAIVADPCGAILGLQQIAGGGNQ